MLLHFKIGILPLAGFHDCFSPILVIKKDIRGRPSTQSFYERAPKALAVT